MRKGRTAAGNQFGGERGQEDPTVLRVGLTAPNIPSRSLAQWCRDFNIIEYDAISHGSITKSRDAFAEILKRLNRQEVNNKVSLPSLQASPDSHTTVFVPHIHDEVLLRMRSRFKDLPPTVCRARSSKILNHDVSVVVAIEQLQWISELQALKRKDAGTIATGLISVIKEIIQSCQK